MRVRRPNRSRPLWPWFMLGVGIVALCGGTACNAILGNHEGHRAADGGGDAASGTGGTSGDGGPAMGGSGSPNGASAPNGGAPNGGAPNGGAPNGGAPNGGTSSAGTSSAGTSSAGTSSAGTSSAGTSSGGMAGTSGTAGSGGGAVSPFCPGTITECGGNLVGTWVIQSSCLILPSTDPTVPAACQTADSYQRYGLTGNITYTDKMWTEDYVEDTLETLNYTGDCITAFHQMNSLFPAPASASNCGKIATNLVASGASTASCPFLNNGCNCAMTFTHQGTKGDSYALITNSEYTNSKDDGHPISYCVRTVNGVTTLTTSETTTENYTFEHFMILSSR